jgi:hypothetical protein
MKNQKVLVKVKISLQENGREITDYTAHLDKQTFLKQNISIINNTGIVKCMKSCIRTLTPAILKVQFLFF